MLKYLNFSNYLFFILILIPLLIFKDHSGLILLYSSLVIFYFISSKNHSNILNIIIFNLICFIFIVEALLFLNLTNSKWIESYNTRSKTFTTTDYFVFDNEKLYDLKPNTTVLETSINLTSGDPKIIYSVQYNIDKNGNRNVDSEKMDININNKEIIFIGCSLMFGSGINDNQTLPYYYSNENKDFNILNLGVPGYGFNQSINKLRNFVSDKTEYVIYLHIPESHSLRDKKLNNQLLENKLNENELSSNGINATTAKRESNSFNFIENVFFESKRLIKKFTFYFIVNDFLVDKVKYNYLSSDANDEKLFYERLDQVRNELSSRDIKFIVIAYDHTKSSRDFLEKFYNNNDYFLASDILDTDNDIDFRQTYTIPSDGHPNALFNKKIAKFLTDYIE